ncbi:MAG: hypothetical protein ACRC10_12160 [Thermoguttaceae bacterium]
MNFESLTFMEEIIDVAYEIIQDRGEPVLPIIFKGEHLRFIGWSREYTIKVEPDWIRIEGPFQDDQPNANEYYQLSPSVARNWLEVRSHSLRLKIPGRGRWGIDISKTPNCELQTARLKTWLVGLHGENAQKYVQRELKEAMYRLPKIYAILQTLAIGAGGFFGFWLYQNNIPIAMLNLTIVLLFFAVFVLIQMFQHPGGLVLGIFLNLGLLAFPLIETFLTGGLASSTSYPLPLFVPFCFVPSAILIPLAMSSYGHTLLDYPRQRQMMVH